MTIAADQWDGKIGRAVHPIDCRTPQMAPVARSPASQPKGLGSITTPPPHCRLARRPINHRMMSSLLHNESYMHLTSKR
jgi:hypothetical protein